MKDIPNELFELREEGRSVRALNIAAKKYNLRWCSKCESFQSTDIENWQVKNDNSYQSYCIKCMRESHKYHQEKREQGYVGPNVFTGPEGTHGNNGTSKEIKTIEVYSQKPINKDENRDWEKELIAYGLDWDHPEYEEDEKYIMGMLGARELRFAEPDKDNNAPRYLIMREAKRRHIKGKTTHFNNYSKLAVRTYERMQDDLMEGNKITLTENYTPRGESLQSSSGVNSTTPYTIDDILNSSGPFSPEEEIILKRIYALKIDWIRSTYREGVRLKEAGKGDPGTVRKKWIADGTAALLIKKHKLPVEYFNSRLTQEYASKNEYMEPIEKKEIDKVRFSFFSWLINLFNFK